MHLTRVGLKKRARGREAGHNADTVNGSGFQFFSPQNARFCAFSRENLHFKKSVERPPLVADCL
jgi:hypothetical protein